MRTAIACIALTFALLGAAPLSPTPAFSASKAHAIDALARAELRSGSTPGLAIGVVQDGLLVYARGFGYADVQHKRAVTPSTQFATGSLTKQFTAACVLLLAQQKKLSLDDKVTRYVPELSIAKNVTLRELLQQTSGLPHPSAGHNLARAITPEELLKAANQLPMLAAPGTVFDDNNFDYFVAGLVVQRVSALPLSSFYSTQIFEPLIMTSSFLAGDQGISPLHARGYTRQAQKFVAVRAWDPSWSFGNSDLVTTVQDLAKWDIGLPLLLNVDSVREMWTQIPLTGQLPYGMGWIVDQRGGERYVWQNGAIPGFHAANAVLPEQHLAVIVLSNAGAPQGETTVQPERLANRILNIVAPLPPAHFANVILMRASEWLGRLARLDVDRTQLTPAFSQYLSDQVIQRAGISALGPVLSIVPIESDSSAADTDYVFDVKFRHGNFRYHFGLTPDGKIDRLSLEPNG